MPPLSGSFAEVWPMAYFWPLHLSASVIAIGSLLCRTGGSPGEGLRGDHERDILNGISYLQGHSNVLQIICPGPDLIDKA